jgi:Uma2 family endonuclease
MSSAAPRLTTEEEFLSLPESTDKLELLDGELILAPRPTYRHQLVLRRVVRALEDWAALQAGEVAIGMAPLDVRFAPGRILQPDAFVLFARISSDHQGPIATIPGLCVEIMSSNRAYDRITKRLVYAEAGVRELWTISTDGQVERWCGERLCDCERPDDVLRSPVLPGFELDLARLRD